MADALIPTLEPYGLHVVPGPDGTEEWRARWFAWRDDLYRLRYDIAAHLEAHPSERGLELAMCAQDPARWLALWAWIEEPRSREGEDAIKPFTPFAFQVELLQWFVAHCDSPAAYDGFASKARGLGATWIFTAGAVWGWLFRPWRGKLVSRKEDLVDKPGDLDSMFGKIDFLLGYLPQWMLPAGFTRDEHRFKLLLKNPVTGGQITGESTTSKTGRGGRATYVVLDEAAFMPGFIEVFGTVAGTTDHRFCVSSESFEEGRGWWTTWHEAKGQDPGCVRELEYWENPYFDEAWFAAERRRWGNDPEGFNREYLRDPYAGSDTFVYPTVREAGFVEKGYDPALPLLVGIDPGRADDTAIVFAQQEFVDGQRRIRWIDSYERNLQPAEWYAHILTGIEPVHGDAVDWSRATARDRQVLEFCASLNWGSDRVRVYMDPAGSQKDMSGLSFWDRIVKESKRLRVRAEAPYQRPIVPLYKELFSHNRHDTRRLAMRSLLMQSEFSDTKGARRLHDALANYRFNKPSEKGTGQPAPIHDEWSHLVSAAEYLAVYVSLGLGTLEKKDRRPLRISIGPKHRVESPFAMPKGVA